MELLQDTHIWFIFSFIIFVGILFKFGMPALNSMLDGRIEQIKKDLEEAENLRVEAQEMLAQYQRKHRDAVQESDKIIATARENAQQFKEKAESELDELITRREAQLEERLIRMEQNAINEIQSYAADLAMNAAAQIIAEKLDKKTNAKLVEQSIGSIEANIH
ncbi:MAG: F0F1 ATP synthase subunit B [Alphaproteobacteria bacterium]